MLEEPQPVESLIMRLRSRRAFLRFVLLFVLPAVALVVVGGHYWVKSTRHVSTENAYIKAHHLAISADIDGRAVRVLVRENDRVKRGGSAVRTRS